MTSRDLRRHLTRRTDGDLDPADKADFNTVSR